MKLVIVESPTKARKLTTYLNKGFQVEASVGHIRDLPKKELAVDLENNFQPKYVVSKDKSKVVKNLKNLAQKADQIILAMDPDREGEAIAWHVKHIIENGKTGRKDSDFLRATFHEITKQAVLKALENPGQINLDLVDAQQARRVLDRLVGYKVSPVLWKKIRRGLSAGRVQSVALRLIVEREREIEKFKPEEYWELDVAVGAYCHTPTTTKDTPATTHRIFKNNKTPDVLPENIFIAHVFEVNNKKYEPKKESDVKDVIKFLKEAGYQVESIDKKERKRASFPPFTTSTLQQAAASRFGFTARQTMSLAQQLYEEGLITYHRTDSFNLSVQAIAMARDYIKNSFGANYLPEKSRVFKKKSKNAQEAHEAIRVTHIQDLPQEIPAKSKRFTKNHIKLYDLIWRRFLASQMQTALYDQTSVTILASQNKKQAKLKSTGSILKFDGWMKLFPGSGDKLLPDLKAKQDLYYQDLNAAQKFTQPPARYNDASLIKELEKRGIGRPSTYASIISVIVARAYVERQSKRFFATQIGKTVNDFLLKYFGQIMDYDFTAKIEDELDDIAKGKEKWQQVVGEFYWPLDKKITSVTKDADRMQIPVKKTGEICPDCGQSDQGEIVIRTGRYGKFKSCSRFPDCKFTQNIIEKVKGVKCPLCQKGEVIIKNTRWGKSFFGCSNYPKCDWAAWKKPEPGEKLTQAEWTKMQKARAERAKKRKARFAKKKSAKKTKK